MYSIHKHVYNITGQGLTCTHIKYGLKRNLISGHVRFLHSTNDYLVVYNNDNLCVYGKNELVIRGSKPKMTKIIDGVMFMDYSFGFKYSPFEKKYGLYYGENLRIYCNVKVCDLITGTTKFYSLDNLYLADIYDIPLGGETKIYNVDYEFKSLTDFLDCYGEQENPYQTYEIRKYKVPYPDYISDLCFVNVEKKWLFDEDYFDKIKIYDLDRFGECVIDISKYRIKYSGNKVAVQERNVFMFDFDTIIAIIGDEVIVIKNYYHIEVYSHHFGVFIDRYMRTFKIIDGKLVRHKLKCDYWCDDDRPDNVIVIVNVLMELYLFPIEICGIIYCELVNVCCAES